MSILKKLLILSILILSFVGYGQVLPKPSGNADSSIEVDKVETNYRLNASNQSILVNASRSITIKPNSHLISSGSSSILIRVDEEAYTPPAFTNGNYVFSRSFQREMSSPSDIKNIKDVIEKISYYDGLGRINQDIQIKYTPDRFDLVKPSSYDNLGRQAKEYLPYKALGDNASYHSTALEDVNSFYLSNYSADLNTNNLNPFSEKEFEDGVLSRPLKQASPSYDWHLGSGNEIKYEYKLNNSSDNVRYFKVNYTNQNTNSPQLVENNTYNSNQLNRNIVKDENHTGTTKNNTNEIFKDKRGRTILKRTYANILDKNEVRHDTYYVYDDYSNLIYVIPPEASKNSIINSTILNNLCYQYKYDYKNRLIEKKIPGKGGPNNHWETIVYNINDQPILTQDPNLKATNSWLFTKYDAFGRIAYTGKMVRNTSRATLQNEANNAFETFVKKNKKYQINGENIGYTNTAYPVNNVTEIYTVNYYDNYIGFDTEGLTVPSTVYGESTNVNTTGLPTCTKVRVLDWPRNLYAWVTTIIGYDEKGRVIYEAKTTPYANKGSIINTKESKLDFTGRIIETKTIHKNVNDTPILTTDIFTYDHMGRLLTQTQNMDGQTEVLVNNLYDDLGNVKQKKLGNTINSPLQTVDYSYNIRSWLKQINDVNNLGKDLFAYKINYNKPELNEINTQPLFNGNVTETIWRTKNDDTKRAYGYSYDALNRITSALFTAGTAITAGEYDTTYAYDLNGNMQNLSRNGWQNTNDYNGMDNLVYTYENNNSNKLLKVQDNGNENYGFKDLANNTVEYTYDANGNMISDANKKITAISYNFLNLPKQITITKNGVSSYINYTYDASGEKLKKTINDRAVSTNHITTMLYSGNYIYENDVLRQFSTPEGYVQHDNGNYSYVYNFKDHLGNVRLSYSDIDKDGSVDQSEILHERNYYPFGLEHRGYNNVVNGTENNYFNFNGKELNKELGLEWLDFGARNYDAALGRWMNLDPLAEQMRRHSPYNYAFNNPIYFIDPDGMAPVGAQNCCGRPPSTGVGIGMMFNRIKRIGYHRSQGNSWGQSIWKGIKGEVATGADFTPIVGDAKGFVETFTGKDLITGDKLGWGSRALGLFMLSELRTVGKVGDVLKGGKWIKTNEHMSEAAASYQKQVSGMDVSDGFKLDGVKFDGLTKDGTLLDAKSGMQNFVDDAGDFKSFFGGKDGIVKQANRQVDAVQGGKIEWHFENENVMNAYQKLFKNEGIEGINLIHTPRQ